MFLYVFYCSFRFNQCCFRCVAFERQEKAALFFPATQTGRSSRGVWKEWKQKWKTKWQIDCISNYCNKKVLEFNFEFSTIFFGRRLFFHFTFFFFSQNFSQLNPKINFDKILTIDILICMFFNFFIFFFDCFCQGGWIVVSSIPEGTPSAHLEDRNSKKYKMNFQTKKKNNLE